MDIKRLNSKDSNFKKHLEGLIASTNEPDAELVRTVNAILQDVKDRGDVALLEYTNRFDQRIATVNDLLITPERIQAAVTSIPQTTHAALEEAARRIKNYHEYQKTESWSYTDEDGNLLGQQINPIQSVGVYVPGGKAVYPSSVLMNVIPAQVAGVSEIIMVVPAPHNELNDVALAAAGIVGVDKVYSVGGAQAIAAMAYGTETIPPVDKIVGPGNRYVAMAKRLLFGTVGIDMIAGPSEVLIVCDGSTDPTWIAMDLFAQAEHDTDARALLVCSDESYIDDVAACIEELLSQQERADIIKTALEKNGRLICVANLDEAADIVNQIAPEHLELSIKEPEMLLPKIHHAGAIFLGLYSAEVLGDYCAGPNHVLPTTRTARFSSPLGVYDFQKRSSLIQCSNKSVSKLAETASILARAEGLTAHARSAELRISKK